MKYCEPTEVTSQMLYVYLFCEGVRDYIHVVDLAKGHIAALRKVEENCGCKVHVPFSLILLSQSGFFFACGVVFAVPPGFLD